MKNSILLFILVFCSIKTWACSCIFENIAQEYMDADFAGIVSIKKTYDNKNVDVAKDFQRSAYKADLAFEKIYKGNEFDALNIYGRINVTDGNSLFVGGCNLYVEKGEKYLVILKKNQNNEYWASLCSRIIYLSSEQNPLMDESEKINSYSNLFSEIEKHKEQFSTLKFVNLYDKTLKLNNKTNKLESDFKKLKIGNPSDKTGFYKVTLNDEMKIDHIVTIKKVGTRDEEIEKIIMKNLSRVQSGYSENKPKELLLLLYFQDF